MSSVSQAAQRDGLMYVSTLGNAIDSLETAAQFARRPDPLRWKWVAIAAHHSLYSFCVAALRSSDRNNVLKFARGKEDIGKWHEVGGYGPKYRSRRDEIEGGPAYRIVWDTTTDSLPQDLKPPKGALNHPRLIDFWTALARVQDQKVYMSERSNIKALTLTDEEILEIIWLADAVRNQMMHFTPKGYMIDISSVISSVGVVNRAVKFLALQSYSIIAAEEDWQTRAASACAELRDALAAASV